MSEYTGLAVFLATFVVVMVLLRNAPYMCERCGRTLDGPWCPICTTPPPPDLTNAAT